MTNKTIGSGGDYADIGSAINSIQYTVAGKLADDYKFTVLNNLTNSTAVNDSWDHSTIYAIQSHGHAVEFDLNGKTITTTVLIWFYKWYSVSSSSVNGNIYFHNGIIIAEKVNAISVLATCVNGDHAINLPFYIYDLKLVVGNGTAAPNGIVIEGVNDGYAPYSYMWNIALYLRTPAGVSTPIGFYFHRYNNGETPATPRNFVENCSIYMIENPTGAATSNGIAHSGMVYGSGLSLKNVAVYSATSGNPCYNINASSTVTNCADSDSSLTIGTNNVHGITIADFLSIDPTSSSFLKIDDSSALYEKGTTSISVWNVADLAGNPRPDANGLVSIGAYEPIIISIQRNQIIWIPPC